ncbi:MAG: hypothetical protein J7647_27550 [Cyanobacteria bacterium SBLK]|nr:hypothetical protein [Cyanobacteria bacterium SBLK]
MTENIPVTQRKPPATLEDKIAYRPACDQLQPRGDGQGQTEWGVTMPDGSFLVFTALPSQSKETAHASMGSSGFCKVGGKRIPIVPPRQAIASIRQTVDLVPVQARPQWHQWGLWGIAIAFLVAGVAYSQWQAKQEREAFFSK